MSELTRKEKVLRERAEAISKPIQWGDKEGTDKIVLEFQLAKERYALNALYVKEVRLINEMTPLPCTPDFVLGVINLRGDILSVIDLKYFFNLPPSGITNLNRVIVVQHEGLEVGILADDIYNERVIYLEELQDDVSSITQENAEFIAGIESDGLIVLDIKTILSSDKIVVDEVP